MVHHASHRTGEKVARPQRLRVGYRNSRINEDVGVEADHRHLCISSRLNLRNLPPQGRPCRITSTACSMAFSRSGVINGGRYGLNIATGLFRLVIRISSPRSTRESKSEKS